MRKSLTTAALVALATGTIIVGVAGPAAAENTSQNCRTVTTHLKDRPDSGFGGNDWAMDDIARKVEICEAGLVTDERTVAQFNAKVKAKKVTAMGSSESLSFYKATVTDTGTFTTNEGKSPSGNAEVAAGVKGHLTGGFTATFVAESRFAHFEANFDNKEYTGTKPTSTDTWVEKVWGSDDFYGLTNMVGWKWTYWTCNSDMAKAVEKWINAEESEGDITGNTPCPTPSATAAPSATATASTPAGGTAGGGTGALPVTGSNTGILAGVAVVLLALGGGLFMAGRRRRRFTA